MYIYQTPDWPDFTWDSQRINKLLAQVKFKQGLLLGKMGALGFALKEEADLRTLTNNIVKTSEIEGEALDSDEVRSSVANHLGLKVSGLVPVGRSVDGAVEMHLDACRNSHQQLSMERLCAWHATLFPSGRSGMQIILPGHLRTDNNGPMQVVSGGYGRERIHFKAPPADELENELATFIKWFNTDFNDDLLIMAGVAHLWFVTLHPFEDGNGRIARAIADLLLARSDGQVNRYYSMSAQIRRERKQYYEILEKTQKGKCDITNWLEWFLNCLDRAIAHSDEVLKNILHKAQFWEAHAGMAFNQRQIYMLNTLFDGFKGKLTSSKWAKMMKCSQDTASRDIAMLIEHKILVKGPEGGRSTNYILKDYPVNVIE